MRTILSCLLAGVALAAALAPLPAAGAERPNIVFILADDMGYGDPASNNDESRIATPNIDRLAAEGMRFTDAHAPAAWCVPSRFGLLTGRYPVRSTLNWRHEAVIKTGTPTLASMLKERGYSTAMIGKWHLGFDGGPNYDFDRPMTGGPLDRGFDSYFGIPASLDIPPFYYIRDRHPVAPPTGHIEASNSEGWTRIQGAFWRAGGLAPGFKHIEVLPRFEREAVSQIAGHAKADADRPLFLYVALSAPHTPWLPLKEFQGKSKAGMYGDFVMQVDHTVGEILNALDKAGMSKNTLVVFSSDNGPVWYANDVQRFGHSSAGPLRGMKSDAWEGGHRIPFLVRWPGHVKSGSLSRQLICFTDMMTTFATLTGGAMPDVPAGDSYNMLPALLGQDGGRPIRKTLVVKETATVIRDGDWKLITHLGSGGFSRPKFIEPEPGGPTGQLYNLADDLGEKHNLWKEHPEIVERLGKMLRAYKPIAKSKP